MPTPSPSHRALHLASETMGEIVTFWGFKASMGRIWTLLYLTPEPLPADEIAERTELSAGAVSMALTELMQWGVIGREPVPSARKRHYRAETDVWKIVRGIVRQRELRLVGRAVVRFEEGVEILEAALAADPGDTDAAFALKRLRGLLRLARTGYRLVEKLADVGQFSLLPIRGSLSDSPEP